MFELIMFLYVYYVTFANAAEMSNETSCNNHNITSPNANTTILVISLTG